MKQGGSRYLPGRLPAISDRGVAILRPVWIALLAATIVLDIAGAVFVYRDHSHNDVVFGRLGLVSDLAGDGSVTFESMEGQPAKPSLPERSRLVSVDGTAVPTQARLWELADMLERERGQTVALAAERPDGSRVTWTTIATDQVMRQNEIAAGAPRSLRMGLRLTLSMLTCVVLIACASLLYLRRAHDPVAMLLSFSFLMLAGSIDPPLTMWIGLGWGTAYDVYSTLPWLLLVIGMASFPDGRFMPPWTRYVLVIGPPAMIVLMIDSIHLSIHAAIAFIAPLVLIASHVVRYRRYSPGIERQQIKWASAGFATGLVSLAIAFFILPFVPASGPLAPWWSLIVLIFFDSGFALIALGLLVALTRFRLWEADRIISRSAVSAAVTLFVAVIWTASIDFVKDLVVFVIGEENDTIAILAGAVMAAGIFSPTQALALKWTRARFLRDHDRTEKLIARLGAWRSAETPKEIAQRTLPVLAGATHADSMAIYLEGPRGLSLLAGRGAGPFPEMAPGEIPGKGKNGFPVRTTLEDEDGPVGFLVAGPRSDGNRYNAEELSHFRQVAEPLAEALRTARRRSEETESMQRALGTVEERLARLEGGGPPLTTG